MNATTALSPDEALDQLEPVAGSVVPMCGLAGSGKTTFSRRLEAKGFLRLSVDELVWERSGRFGLDYAAADYPMHLEAARDLLKARLIEVMRNRAPAVVDSAFWNQKSREDYRVLIAAHGCKHTLIYLKADPEVLRERLSERSRRFDANAAFPVTDDMQDRFMGSFEAPWGEGEIVVAT